VATVEIVFSRVLIRKGKMRVHYDNEVDAVYIKLGTQKPDGVVEIADGVNLEQQRMIK